MRLLADYLPLIAFGAAYFMADIYVATGVLIVALFLVVAGYWLINHELHKMHLITAILALIFGGVTIAVHDPLFIKLKPSVLYLVFAAVLAGSVYIGKKNVMERLLGSQLELPSPVWDRLSFMWAGFFVFSALLNLYVAFNYSNTFWVDYKLFGMTSMSFVFALLTGVYLYRHMPRES